MPTWVWDDNVLRDADGAVIAQVRADVIFVGEHRLLVESTSGPCSFRLRITAENGEMITMQNAGLTVHSLTASCADRRYRLDRVSPLRKERVISKDGRIVARVVAHRTSLSVFGMQDFPLLDAVALTWGCLLVDAPGRNIRIS